VRRYADYLPTDGFTTLTLQRAAQRYVDGPVLVRRRRRRRLSDVLTLVGHRVSPMFEAIRPLGATNFFSVPGTS
jgi:hypothetical protein